MSQSIEITSSNFQTEVAESDIPVLLDMWAAWRGRAAWEPHRRRAGGRVRRPDQGREARRRRRARPRRTVRCRVIPTIVLIKDGQVVAHAIGARPRPSSPRPCASTSSRPPPRRPDPSEMGRHVSRPGDGRGVPGADTDARGPFTSRRWRPLYPAQHLLVDVGLPDGAHPGPLVEPARIGRVLGVDAKPDAPLAALPEPCERLEKKRQPEPTTAPCRPHGQCVHEPHLELPRRRERDAAHLPALAGDRPQRRVEAGILELPLPPVLDGFLAKAPLVGKRLLHARVDGPQVLLRPKGRHGHAVRPGGRRRRLRHVDLHPQEVPHRAVAAALEQVAGGPVHVQHGVLDDDTRGSGTASRRSSAARRSASPTSSRADTPARTGPGAT